MNRDTEMPVAGDHVEYTEVDGLPAAGVLAEVYRTAASDRLRARVCDSRATCRNKEAGVHLNYCQLQRVPTKSLGKNDPMPEPFEPKPLKLDPERPYFDPWLAMARDDRDPENTARHG
jgi:hypothetical protein